MKCAPASFIILEHSPDRIPFHKFALKKSLTLEDKSGFGIKRSGSCKLMGNILGGREAGEAASGKVACFFKVEQSPK